MDSHCLWKRGNIKELQYEEAFFWTGFDQHIAAIIYLDEEDEESFSVHQSTGFTLAR
jgi:hypothetical protein